MKKIQHLFFVIVLCFFLSGCIGAIALVGTVATTATTTQEVDEEYDGDFLEYMSDKMKSFSRYVKTKTSDKN